MRRRRAAHFLLVPELAYSPPNEALVSALLEQDYDVELFAPGGDLDTSRYGAKVRAQNVEYGYRWLLRHMLSPRWRGYDIFSGTTEDPMAVAGNLARLHRRPCITMADEIKSGSFRGNRTERWKALCRRGMRAANVTVVNEEQRIDLQRDYAGLHRTHPIMVYPGCFHSPPESMDRRVVRQDRGIPADALVVCYSGVLNQGNGALWLARAVGEAPEDVWFWAQLVSRDVLVPELFGYLRGAERLYLEPRRLPWREAWAAMGGVDIGMVVYLQEGPQFRHMGTASNRLCMFLAMGVPVIASRQPSFEFVERYECGVLVDSDSEFVSAIGYIAARLDTMKENARRCAREYIDAPGRYKVLKERVTEL